MCLVFYYVCRWYIVEFFNMWEVGLLILIVSLCISQCQSTAYCRRHNHFSQNQSSIDNEQQQQQHNTILKENIPRFCCGSASGSYPLKDYRKLDLLVWSWVQNGLALSCVVFPGSCVCRISLDCPLDNVPCAHWTRSPFTVTIEALTDTQRTKFSALSFHFSNWISYYFRASFQLPTEVLTQKCWLHATSPSEAPTEFLISPDCVSSTNYQ
jgi:hypothetical protein